MSILDKVDLHVAIVGATGAVGVELMRLLETRLFPVGKLSLLASARSAGKTMPFKGEELPVQELTKDSFAEVDLALFSASTAISKELVPIAAQAGAVVVDNSSAFRMDPEVPLVVPEINPEDLSRHRGIIANPNCTTAISVMALYPLHLRFGLRKVIASSYQAVSGSGAPGIAELESQVTALAKHEPVVSEVYPYQIAFNALPQVDSFLDNGYTKEEMKLVHEGRKIMRLPELQASITCVRVPVYRAHSVAITAEFEQEVDVAVARDAISQFPGIQVMDSPEESLYPTPVAVSGEDDCYVGRIRKDLVFGENGLSFWVVGDQLLKGAALNAVQIAEELVSVAKV